MKAQQYLDRPSETGYRQVDKTAAELFSSSFIWWILLGFSKLWGVGGVWGSEGGVSRRMVRTPLTWIFVPDLTQGVYRLTCRIYYGSRRSIPLSFSVI